MTRANIAIMTPVYLNKVLNGTKTIESRWTTNRIVPFPNGQSLGAQVDDLLYFKRSGGMIEAFTTISKTEYFTVSDMYTLQMLFETYRQKIAFEPGAEDFIIERFNKAKHLYCSIITFETPVTFCRKQIEHKDQRGWLIYQSALKVPWVK